jgi:N-acetylmuramoyl-L-alanine amidase
MSSTSAPVPGSGNSWPRDHAGPAPEGLDPLQALRLLGCPMDAPDAALRAYRMRARGDAAIALDAEDARILHALTSAGQEPAP